MCLNHRTAAVLAFLATAGTGCHKPTPTPLEIVESRITERFVSKFVRPLSDPVAELAHKGADLPPELLARNKVTAIEVIRRKGAESEVIFEEETRRPPNAGMITGVQNARKIGLYYPASLDQPEIEVRVNYDCDICGFVAVHVVVPNPLACRKGEMKWYISAGNTLEQAALPLNRSRSKWPPAERFGNLCTHRTSSRRNS